MKLSVCMIVKNEEEMLPRALQSVHGKADEIIVVDTGSTDKTVEIAKKYGAKVYHHKWQHDFSLHRNQSIDYATGDWLLILDADEEVIFNLPHDEFKNFLGEIGEKTIWTPLETRSGAWIGDQITSLGISVHDIQREQISMMCNGLRLFRKGHVRYHDIVHNQPETFGLSALCPHIHLRHHGYDLSNKKMKKKFHRSRNLLLKRLQEDPTDYAVYFFLAQLYGMRKDRENTIKYGELYLSHKKDLGRDFNGTIYYTLICQYQAMGNHERANEIIAEGLACYPNHPDLSFSLSNSAVFSQNLPLLAESVRKYVLGYNQCRDDATSMGGRFYFTLKDDVVNLQLYRIVIADLIEGIYYWRQLVPQLKAKQSIPNGLYEELQTNFKKLGLDFLLREIPFLNTGTPEITGSPILDQMAASGGQSILDQLTRESSGVLQ